MTYYVVIYCLLAVTALFSWKSLQENLPPVRGIEARGALPGVLAGLPLQGPNRSHGIFFLSLLEETGDLDPGVQDLDLYLDALEGVNQLRQREVEEEDSLFQELALAPRVDPPSSPLLKSAPLPMPSLLVVGRGIRALLRDGDSSPDLSFHSRRGVAEPPLLSGSLPVGPSPEAVRSGRVKGYHSIRNGYAGGWRSFLLSPSLSLRPLFRRGFSSSPPATNRIFAPVFHPIVRKPFSGEAKQNQLDYQFEEVV